MLTLKSIAEEAADCRVRCANLKVGDLALHVHHKIFAERLTEPVDKRIQYILAHKTDNVALRLRLLGPVVEDAEVLADERYRTANADRDKARADWKKASADWKKARADWIKACADWDKACADWKKARADWIKACADWEKACADWEKASGDVVKACADWKKANADWEKASADWKKVYLPHYHRLFPESPWNGKTIFAGNL